MKRLLTLSAILLLSIMTFASTLIDGIYYEFSGTEATVVSGANKYTGDVIIPASVTNGEQTYSVTSIGGDAFDGCSGLTSITIPTSVMSIGYAAFVACSGLTSIIIPNSVMSIGDYAFSGCLDLTSITIPNSVTSIGEDAFDGTSWYNNQPNGLVYAGKVAYKYKGTMPANTSISIKDGTLGIAYSAFSGCSGLTSVVIPNGVTNIGEFTFNNCTGLTSVAIPNSVTSIGRNAFSGCSGLTSMTIPNSVKSIGNSAFSGCSGLASITVDGGNSKYDSRNNCNAIIETSSNTLIAGCKNTVIPCSVTSIGGSTFSKCSGLTFVTIPNSVTSIEAGGFYQCTGLTSITIPNSVTSIGISAFNGCSGLTTVTIGKSVTSIGVSAFSGCSGLISIYSYIEEPTSDTGSIFTYSTYSNATLYVPKGTKDKYLATDGWKDFNDIEEFTYELGTTNLNSKGYATLSYASDVEVEGADVYTAVKNGNKISCTKVEQVVPAYNGVILKGEPNAEVTLNYIYTEQDELAGNELKATTTATGTAASETALVLSGKTFVNYTGGDFVADKAYMPYDGNSAHAIEMVFDDATVVNSIASNNDLLDKTVIKTIEDGKLVIKTANGKYSSVGAKMK